MTYKGSNWTRGELGRVPDRNPTIECGEQTCNATVRSQSSKAENWHLTPDPSEPVLCPMCLQRTPNPSQTPTDYREEANADLTAFVASGADE